MTLILILVIILVIDKFNINWPSKWKFFHFVVIPLIWLLVLKFDYISIECYLFIVTNFVLFEYIRLIYKNPIINKINRFY